MKKQLFILTVICTFYFSAIGFGQTPATIDVTVLDFKGKPYAGDKVYFVGQQKKQSLFGITNAKGKFKINLPQGDIYDIRIKSIGDELEYNTIEIPELYEGELFDTMEVTITYEMPKSYTLNNLQFETGKANLKPESYNLLEDLIEIMKLKPGMKIEIAGHTDSDGEDAANLLLSQNRASAVKAYLVSKGVKGDRVSTIGHGETRPVADNATTSGKAKNRRTEIRILK